MDSSVLRIGNNATVADAIDRIRTSAIDENMSIVFVIDEDEKYIGDVYVNKLLTRPEQTRISNVIDSKTLFVRVDTEKDRVRDIFNKYNLFMIPVLNQDDQLVGRITADQVNGKSLRKGVSNYE